MTAQRLTFAEAIGTLGDVQQGPATGRRFRALLIRAGWGSSGHYSAEVLRRDGPKVWPAGTKNYLNHPTLSESVDLPERSVKDLASRLVTDPVWDESQQGLVAEVEVFPQWAGLLNEDFAKEIGLSIRAYGTAETGEVEGRTGPVITSLDEGISVDWVTEAGAGGRVLELIESAQTTVREAAVSDKPWSTFTQADYDIAQWRRACLIGPDSQSDTKGDYKVPVKEPDGTLNRNGVHAATGAHGISAVTGISADARKAAAKKLVGLYRNQLNEDPPAGLLTLAGEQQESSRRTLAEKANVGHYLESRIHSHFTNMADDMFGEGRLTRPERIGLSGAIGDGLKAFTSRVTADHPQLYERGRWQEPAAADGQMSETARRRRLREADGMTANELSSALSDAVREVYGGEGIFTWVRDSTAEWVVFSVEDDTDCDLFQQAYTVDVAAQEVTLTGDPVEVIARTTYSPAPPDPDDVTETGSEPLAESGSETGQGSPPAEDKDKEGAMPELTEAEARELTEARDKAVAEAAAAQTAAAQAIADKQATDLALARFKAAEAARPAAAKILAESTLPTPAQARILAALTADSMPLTDAGVLDEAALKTRIDADITAESTYLASLAEDAGQGTPRGLRESDGNTGGGQADPAATKAALVEAYKARGMSPGAAELAATGRPF